VVDGADAQIGLLEVAFLDELCERLAYHVRWAPHETAERLHPAGNGDPVPQLLDNGLLRGLNVQLDSPARAAHSAAT
jgi:hypothetical protein